MSIVLNDFEPTLETFADAVLRGMAEPQKRVPCKYFYDEIGSQLFDRICTLDEYYPTRTETALLERIAPEIALLAGPECQLIELGSGASRKVRTLIDALERPAAYVPVDISRTALVAAAREIAEDYPSLRVTAICADYTEPFVVTANGSGQRLAFFPGSTVGNFTPPLAQQFLHRIALMLGPSGALLIGVDLKKDSRILNAAYNDALGITAAFNLNLLHRINRELCGDFDLAAFHHHAFYNEAGGRIEMHIVSDTAQKAHIAGREFSFAAGETIHTEDSHKYALGEFQSLAGKAGFSPLAFWTDPAHLFSVHYLTVR